MEEKAFQKSETHLEKIASLKNQKVNLSPCKNALQSALKDDLKFNLTIDNSEPWWSLDVSDETKDQFRRAIVQYCVHSNLNAYHLKESMRQVKEMLHEMANINPQWRSVTYYNFNEKYLAHKAFYLELRYVLRKRDQLNAQINAARYTTPNQPP